MAQDRKRLKPTAKNWAIALFITVSLFLSSSLMNCGSQLRNIKMTNKQQKTYDHISAFGWEWNSELEGVVYLKRATHIDTMEHCIITEDGTHKKI